MLVKVGVNGNGFACTADEPKINKVEIQTQRLQKFRISNLQDSFLVTENYITFLFIHFMAKT
jgi:hypothetical protein